MTARPLYAVLTCAASAWATPLTYTVTDLGDLPDGSDCSYAQGINNYGQVVGYSSAATGDRAFLWTPAVANGKTGSIINLGDLPGGADNSQAMDINAQGQVTGHSAGSASARGFVWTPAAPNGTTGSMIELDALPGSSGTSYGTGINSAGQVVGYSYAGYYPNQHYRPFLRQPSGGGLINLDALSASNDSMVYSINSSGQAVGRSGSFATLWNPGTPNGSSGTLLSLGDLPGGNDSSSAVAINDAGQVAGTCSVATTNGWRGAVWTPTAPNGTVGSWTSIGDLSGGIAHSNALDINNLGQVVGYSNAAGGDRAVFWSSSEGLQDLNTLLDGSGMGWTLIKAQALNDNGQIVGYGTYDPDGPGPQAAVTHGFLLTPVPEPCTLGALMAALAMLGVRRRK